MKGGGDDEGRGAMVGGEIERVAASAATAGCVLQGNLRTCWHNARSGCVCQREAAWATSTACGQERLR